MRLARLTVPALALALLASPLTLEGQPAGKTARVGILWGASPAFRPDTELTGMSSART